MLNLFNDKKDLIHQWPINTPDLNTDLDLIVHCHELLTHHSDEQCTTIFYGFLDQECQQKTPATFVSEVLKKEGVNGLNQCYGSFILLHYNYKNKELLLANDALGDFAAHYTQGHDKLMISDFPAALLHRNNTTIDETRVLHFFAHTHPQNKGCFYSEIKQLNPGVSLMIETMGRQEHRYYHPEQKVNYKLNNINELGEEFKHLLQSAILHQTQNQENIGIMMSGGMDSTFVAGNALKMNKKVSSFSYVFPNHSQADEGLWIDAMRQLDLDMHTFSGEPHWPLKSPVHVSLNSPILNPYRPLKDVIYQSSVSKNIKYLVTGCFADHLYVGYIYWLVDQLKINPVKGLSAFCKLVKSLGLVQGLKQMAPLKWSTKAKLFAPWMNPEALRLHQRHFSYNYGNKHPHPQQWALTFGLNTAQSHWLENEYAFKNKVMLRHPFRDRRVVEFLMALPAYVLGDVNNPKAFVRKAAIGVIPDAIIRRKTITTLEPLFVQGLLEKEYQKVNDLLMNSRATWQQYVDKTIIYRILKKPKEQHHESELLGLWYCVSYELWLAALAQFKSQT